VIDAITLGLVLVIILAGGYRITRNELRHKDIKTKYAVTLKGNEGSFAGLLVEESRDKLTFEHCNTVPEKAGDAIQPILGRVHVDRVNIAYRQELPSET
jgi:hypothetical protein